jgi:hypothetical protein
VVSLDPVVGMAFDVVPRRRDRLVEPGRVHQGRVGDDLGGCHLQGGQRPAEAPTRCHSVPAGRDGHVDDLPVLIHARYTYRQTPFTLTYVSSTNHLSPGACRQNLAASASSGVKRCTHRKIVTWSTSTPRSISNSSTSR